MVKAPGMMQPGPRTSGRPRGLARLAGRGGCRPDFAETQLWVKQDKDGLLENTLRIIANRSMQGNVFISSENIVNEADPRGRKKKTKTPPS